LKIKATQHLFCKYFKLYGTVFLYSYIVFGPKMQRKIIHVDIKVTS